MERLVKGNVIVVPFPFSDLSSVKRRPALVVSVLHGNDIVLCQITSKKRHDRYSIQLEKSDFETGFLPASSFIRPNMLFTAEDSIVMYRIGSIKSQKLNEVVESLCKILRY
ncbi:MAG: type II toxin-antitoxin system PemK/MazF family toxin [Candidatus Aenigmarchaeota archaeon]|nr:type II toxin-antitoxin system PemK/MazF family toxin [Candidatus Aenigmarchaeota archaeon]